MDVKKIALLIITSMITIWIGYLITTLVQNHEEKTQRRKENEYLRENIQELTDKNKELTDKIQDLTNYIAAQNTTIANLTTEVSQNMNIMKESIDTMLESGTHLNQNFKQTLDSVSKKLTQAKQQIEQVTEISANQNHHMKEALSELKNKTDFSSKKFGDLKETLNADVNSVKSDILKMGGNLMNVMGSIINDFKSELRNFGEELTEKLSTKISSIIIENKKTTSECDALYEQNQVCNATLTRNLMQTNAKQRSSLSTRLLSQQNNDTEIKKVFNTRADVLLKWPEADPFQDIQPTHISVYTGRYEKNHNTVITGMHFVFTNLKTNETLVRTYNGTQTATSKESYDFERGERITAVIIHSGDRIDQMEFVTSKNELFRAGGAGGHSHLPLINIQLDGFYGEYSDTFLSIGCSYFQL